MNTRRRFVTQLITAAGIAGCLRLPALAADAPAKIDESDPTAKALGYTPDTTKVDPKKYPTHKPDQNCAGCALYPRKNATPDGPCTAFGGKLVASRGWCMAYAPRPKE
jgi:hypothetical protein